MNKVENKNFIRGQVYSLPDLVDHQVDSCFGSNVINLLSTAEILDTRKIILTGCGDSYAAALAMGPVIGKYSNCSEVQVMRTIEFTRFLSKEQIGMEEINSILVIAISVGGSTARVCEALEKANKVGALSILLTNNPESKAASIAKRIFFVNTPAFPNDSPGLRSYFASLVGLIALASRLGHVQGTLAPTTPAIWENTIINYVKDYEGAINEIDSQISILSEKWKDFKGFDFIGDDVEYASALFGAAKFIECCGSLCTWDDSEDWCHINYFLKDPQEIGTIIMADRHSASFGRVLETIESAKKIGRPVLVVTNADKNIFIDGVNVCKIPDTPEGFEWLMPLMDHLPATLLAGHIAELNNLNYFRQPNTEDGQPDLTNPQFSPDIITTSNSKIEIYE